MIYPRLALARNLLRNDGVIFISIDDNEVAQLRKICDEVFGESNFVAQFIWEKRVTRENRKMISVRHDYLICYAKNLLNEQDIIIGLLPMTDEAKGRYINPDNDKRGIWTSVPAIAQAGHGTKSQFYALTTPSGRIVNPPSGSCWRYTKNRMQEAIADNRIWFGSDSNGVPRIKKFLSEGKQGLTPETLWLSSDVGTNDSAKRDIINLFNGLAVFETPKPVELIKQCINICVVSSDDIVLDFFAGTSPTAHAVMQLNAEDGGNRKFIMVQLPEVCAPETEAAKAGYKNICEIGKERIRRAGEKIKAEIEAANKQPKLDGETKSVPDIGFRVLKLDDTNMKDVYYAAGEYTQKSLTDMISNIKDDRTDMDLLYGCLLDWGLPLSLPHTHEQIDGVTVHTYNNGDLMACFAPRISEKAVREIAERKPLRVVFRDSSFSNSPEKINVEEIFKLFAHNTTVKVI
jgi:adenine-specific DNA-methyltransferase